MGDARRYAERMDLIATQPRLDLASTGYALADAGSEYLVLEPYGDGRVFTVDLAPGSYTVEWFDVAAGETSAANPWTVEQGRSGRIHRTVRIRPGCPLPESRYRLTARAPGAPWRRVTVGNGG